MKTWLYKNILYVALGAVISLIILGIVLTFHNNQVIQSGLKLKAQAEDIKLTSEEILKETLHGLDLGVRGYAITKQDQLLIPFNNAVGNNEKIFGHLKEELGKQGYPIEEINPVHERASEYIAFCAKMNEEAKIDSMETFKKMLNEDRGYYVWKEYDNFTKKLFAFEDNLIKEADDEVRQAMSQNLWVKLVLLAISIPSFWVIIARLKNEDTKRNELLEKLDNNNKAYLFDPGESAVSHLTQEEILAGSIEGVKEVATFIKKIASGDYNASWDRLNDQNKHLNEHTLVGELLEMRDKMKQVKSEDEKRIWTTDGLTKFSEIVRNNQHSIADMSEEVVRFMAKHLKAQQVSLFILNQDSDGKNKRLSLSGCYAYNRKKFIDKDIEIGEGLIGQCYLEKDHILLTEVPDGYTEITSGMGQSTPNCILIVPMIYNESVEAIIELASFHVFEQHEISFMERAGEFLSSSLSNVKIAERTEHLLKLAQTQAEQMRGQEEELRQNMEELVATQEELARKSLEQEKEIKSLREKNNSLLEQINGQQAA
jgi:hypothetical protein